MRIPESTLEELVAKVESSQLRPEAKATVLAILAKSEVSDEEMGRVLRAIQNDIEQDFAEVPGVNEVLESDTEYQALVAKQEEEIAEIEQTVRQSADFVDAQMAEIDSLEGQLSNLEGEQKIEEVRGKLGME